MLFWTMVLRFQSWLLCHVASGLCEVEHHGGQYVVEDVAHFMAWKQKGSNGCSSGHRLGYLLCLYRPYYLPPVNSPKE